MNILIDTSTWIDYFRSGKRTHSLDILIDENLIVTNDLILTELIPFLRMKNQRALIALLRKVRKQNLKIDWNEIMEWQTTCLKNGTNGIGIPDLIIAQNALQHRTPLFSLDHHFEMISRFIDLPLFDANASLRDS